MELHQLRYLVAVARTTNFSRAAEHCHVSQPSLSQQIQKLEDELGERLFDRLPRHAKLTAAGEAFLPRAQRILTEIETARREVRDARGLLRGQVTVGVLPTIAPYFLPRAIAAFSAAFPGVEVVVQLKSPNVSRIASAIAPVGSPPPCGFMICQNIVWLTCPPPLLMTVCFTPAGTVSICFNSSIGSFLSNSGSSANALLRFAT